MALFRRRKNRSDSNAKLSGRQTKKAELDALREFAKARRGVEAFIEPATPMTQTTMLLVADDGESFRRRIRSVDAGTALARKLQIPCYEVNRVGYPQRMREYNLRQKRGQSTGTATTTQSRTGERRSAQHRSTEGRSTQASGTATGSRHQSSQRPTQRPTQSRSQRPSPSRSQNSRTPAQTRAITTLESAAGVSPLPAEANSRQLQALLRKARAAAHPDRQGGDRTMWDRVEESARVLGIENA